MLNPTTLPTSFQAAKILEQVHLPQHFPELGDVLSFCYKMGPGEAAIFLIVGVIMLLFGINVFKGVVIVNAAIVGAAAGAFLGDRAGNESVGAVIGGFTAAVLAWPLMKHAVAIMGFAIGSLVGASLWRIFAVQHPELYWAGGFIGGVTFGLLSFLLFRGCVMMYTSLQGASMAVFGDSITGDEVPGFGTAIDAVFVGQAVYFAAGDLRADDVRPDLPADARCRRRQSAGQEVARNYLRLRPRATGGAVSGSSGQECLG